MSLRSALLSVLKSSLIIGSLGVPHSLAAASPVQYIPSAANSPGLYGATFKTRLFIEENNSGGVVLVLTAATPAGLLSARLTVVRYYSSDNVLEELFGYTGGAAISVAVAPEAGGATFVMRAEVYTAEPFGEMTTPLQILTLGDAVASSPADDYSGSFVVGLNSDANSRINIGCSNFTSNPATVRFLLTGHDGIVANHTFLLAPGEWSQTAIEPPSGLSAQDGYFFAQGTPSGSPIFCYAVRVSNSSNDGTLIPAVRNTPLIISIPSA